MICLTWSIPNWDLFRMPSLGFGDNINMISSNTDMFRWHSDTNLTFNSTLTFFILHTFMSVTNIGFASCLQECGENTCSARWSCPLRAVSCAVGVWMWPKWQPPHKGCCSLWRWAERLCCLYALLSKQLHICLFM